MKKLAVSNPYRKKLKDVRGRPETGAWLRAVKLDQEQELQSILGLMVRGGRPRSRVRGHHLPQAPQAEPTEPGLVHGPDQRPEKRHPEQIRRRIRGGLSRSIRSWSSFRSFSVTADCIRRRYARRK